eukprot:GHVU01234156.1.p1 GENE.GHVU01234156.1~~GHVU01234156.1.p1  ORF type:complete len:133 (+),score=9.08 GHVU01234156.1:37-399(+)
MEASIHDVRLIPSLSHPSSLLENLKYVISALEHHCSSTPRAPTPLPIEQALNNMLSPQTNLTSERKIAPPLLPRAASAADEELWPTAMAIAARPTNIQQTSKAKRLGRCDAVFSLRNSPE